MTAIAHDTFSWTDQFLLGYAPMDDTHHEFVDIVGAMLSAGDGAFPSLLARFTQHAEQHFAQERDWMARSAFPAMDCHVDEHNAVLQSVYEVRDLIAAGAGVDIGRQLARELMRWFPGHADYMDAALAQWMVRQRLGGVPVVLRRGAARQDSDSR